MVKELDLIEEKGIREKLVDNVEVLDKVKELHTLPGTEYMITRQVAEYYDTDNTHINKIWQRNNDELVGDGVKHYKHNEIKEITNKGIMSSLRISPNGSLLFPKRAVLRVGMLLRDSEVAKEVRTLLLNVYHDAQEGKEDISENITKEYNEQMKLYMEYGKAISEGNMEEVVRISTAINEIKNKRIKETEKKLAKSEEEKLEMAINSTSIQEAKQVIRRIVNVIASKRYQNNFPYVWTELHKKVNYLLKINIKKRGGAGSLLNKYTEDEIYEVEKIAKNWAVKEGLDLESILGL